MYKELSLTPDQITALSPEEVTEIIRQLNMLVNAANEMQADVDALKEGIGHIAAETGVSIEDLQGLKKHRLPLFFAKLIPKLISLDWEPVIEKVVPVVLKYIENGK